MLVRHELLATTSWDSFLTWQNPGETVRGFDFSVLTPVVAWVAAAAVLLVGRYLLAWSDLRTSTIANAAASSRVLGRLLGMAIIWLLLSLGWEAGRALASYFHHTSSWQAAGYGSIVVAAAEVFRRIRSWMTAQPTKVQTGSFLDLLKPLLPQILAYFVVGASFVLVAAAIAWFLTADWMTLAAAVVIDLLVLTFLCWLVDPESLGLHAFYREKILRTYLGASNTSLESIANCAPTAADNRRTLPDRDDDVILADLVKDPHFFPLCISYAALPTI